MMEKIRPYLDKSRKVLVLSHVNPDGDAVSSLMAMGLALEKINKTVTFYNESKIPAVYRFLPCVERITHQIDPNANFDTAIVLDCGSLKRIGNAIDRVRQIQVVLNIDHHLTNDGFGHACYVDTQACATTELIYRLLKACGIPFDAAIATSIYTGILTDTGSFRFSNTNPGAFAICSEMAQLGVNPHAVAQHVYGTYSLGRIKLLNLALDSIEISKNGKLSIMTVTQDMLNQTCTHAEDADGLIHYARRIEDVKVAALIQEFRNGKEKSFSQPHYHVSLRSDGSVDVAAIAAGYGGGGHLSAAGFGLDASITEVKTVVSKMADRL